MDKVQHTVWLTVEPSACIGNRVALDVPVQ